MLLEIKMKMKKCLVCREYTLKSEHCNKKTEDAGYKFIRVKKEATTSNK